MNTDVLQGDYSVTQDYGATSFPMEWLQPDGTHFHTGIDLGAPLGTVVAATCAGTVWSIGDPYGGPYAVTLSTDDGHWIRYLHLEVASVVVGQTVLPQSVIGFVGSLGNSTGPHLHFEVRTDPGQGPQGSIDPTPYLYFPLPVAPPVQIIPTEDDDMYRDLAVGELWPCPVAPNSNFNLLAYLDTAVEVSAYHPDGTPIGGKNYAVKGNVDTPGVGPIQCFDSAAGLGIGTDGGSLTFHNAGANRCTVWLHREG